MKKSVALLILLLAAPLTAPALAQAEKEVSECDRLAAHPSDPNRPDGISGVDFGKLDPALAIPACEQALKQLPGDARYQMQLARSFVKANRNLEALKFYRLAAEQGYAAAEGSLGSMYYLGRGVPQDYAEALKWYRLSVEQGNAVAQKTAASCTKKATACRRTMRKP